MGVELLCPNCRMRVGEASSEDGYKDHWDHLGVIGQPICKHCGSGESTWLSRNFFVILAITLAVVTIAMMVFDLNNQ